VKFPPNKRGLKMKKSSVKIRVLKTYEIARIVDCQFEDGEYVYYCRQEGVRGLFTLLSEQFEVL
jgi:hypothetical protein